MPLATAPRHGNCFRLPEFNQALTRGGAQADANIAESLYRRGMGYEHLATKIFMPASRMTRAQRSASGIRS